MNKALLLKFSLAFHNKEQYRCYTPFDIKSCVALLLRSRPHSTVFHSSWKTHVKNAALIIQIHRIQSAHYCVACLFKISLYWIKMMVITFFQAYQTKLNMFWCACKYVHQTRMAAEWQVLDSNNLQHIHLSCHHHNTLSDLAAWAANNLITDGDFSYHA